MPVKWRFGMPKHPKPLRNEYKNSILQPTFLPAICYTQTQVDLNVLPPMCKTTSAQQALKNL